MIVIDGPGRRQLLTRYGITDQWFSCKDQSGLAVCPPIDVKAKVVAGPCCEFTLGNPEEFNKDVKVKDALINLSEGTLKHECFNRNKHRHTDLMGGVECAALSGIKADSGTYVQRITFRYRTRVRTKNIEF